MPTNKDRTSPCDADDRRQKRKKSSEDDDLLDEELEETFPASDAPSHSPGRPGCKDDDR